MRRQCVCVCVCANRGEAEVVVVKEGQTYPKMCVCVARVRGAGPGSHLQDRCVGQKRRGGQRVRVSRRQSTVPSTATTANRGGGGERQSKVKIKTVMQRARRVCVRARSVRAQINEK